MNEQKLTPEILKSLNFTQVPQHESLRNAKSNFYYVLISVIIFFVLGLLTVLDVFEMSSITVKYICMAILFVAILFFVYKLPGHWKIYKNSIAQQKAVKNMISNYDGNLIVVSEQSVMVVPATLNSNVTSDDLKAFNDDWIARLDVQKHQEIILVGIAWVDDKLNALDLEMDDYRKTQDNLQGHVIEDEE